MEYYLSEYIQDGEGRRVPRVAEGAFTSINIQDKAIVALLRRSDGPGRVHIASDAKEPSKVPSRLLGEAFGCSLGGINLAVCLAELLMKHIPPGLRPYSPPKAWTAIHGPTGEIKYLPQVLEGHGEKWQIWLGNECIWEKPCIRGGLLVHDNFNRKDEVPLTTGVTADFQWDVASAVDLPELRRTTPGNDGTGIVRAPKNEGTRHRGAKWNSVRTPFTGNHNAQIQSGALYSTVGPMLRHQAGARTMYYIYYFQNHSAAEPNTQDLYISKFVGGVETVLATTKDDPNPGDHYTTFTFNTAVAFTVRGEASGSTIKAFFATTGTLATPRLTVTDTAITGGMPGFDISSRPAGAFGGSFNQDADNFQAEGDIDGFQLGQPISC